MYPRVGRGVITDKYKYNYRNGESAEILDTNASGRYKVVSRTPDGRILYHTRLGRHPDYPQYDLIQIDE